ncbi:MAG TPA: hypothetical protein VH914_08060 [Acidimicrobiia bacterium]|nr:hypothetical protein [Acidimicrobiia bacterium]
MSPGAAECAHEKQAGDDVARKGRARRFREARELKQGYDDGLFKERDATLADVLDDGSVAVDEDDDDFEDEEEDWDPDHQAGN